MKATFNLSDACTYIDNSDIIKFISENAPMDWNDCCDFVRDEGIVGEEGKVYWAKEDLIKNGNLYNPNAVKWILAFFEAHPFVGEKIMICFDD